MRREIRCTDGQRKGNKDQLSINKGERGGAVG